VTDFISVAKFRFPPKEKSKFKFKFKMHQCLARNAGHFLYYASSTIFLFISDACHSRRDAMIVVEAKQRQDLLHTWSNAMFILRQSGRTRAAANSIVYKRSLLLDSPRLLLGTWSVLFIPAASKLMFPVPDGEMARS
jgi:hypothetical protein